jgi:hypothetical protein
VSAGEWILLVVGAAQAIALAVAAVFAWKTYEAAKEDREIARLEPVIRETQVSWPRTSRESAAPEAPSEKSQT